MRQDSWFVLSKWFSHETGFMFSHDTGFMRCSFQELFSCHGVHVLIVPRGFLMK